MEKVISKLVRGLEVLFGLAGIAMIVVESYAVFARNVLKIATPWTDEFLKLLFVWSIFVCAALAFSDDSLIALTLVEDSEAVKRHPAIVGVMKLIQYVSALGISGLLVQQVSTIIATQVKTWEITTVMKYPLWIVNMGILVGMAMACILAVIKIIDCRKYFVKTSNSN